jgi:hypothetical protein
MYLMYCSLIKMQRISQSKNKNKWPEGGSLNRPSQDYPLRRFLTGARWRRKTGDAVQHLRFHRFQLERFGVTPHHQKPGHERN